MLFLSIFFSPLVHVFSSAEHLWHWRHVLGSIFEGKFWIKTCYKVENENGQKIHFLF